VRTMSTQNIQETTFTIDRSSDLLEYPSWESLPWPALNRTLSFLHTNKECFDLANLSKVSTHFNNAVKEFMRSARNRPGLECVALYITKEGLMVQMYLYRSNLPFYGLGALDWSRFKRSIRNYSPTCMMEVELRGADDPAVSQLHGLLSAPIERVCIEELHGCLSAVDLTLFSDVLQYIPSISFALLINVVLDDETAPFMLSISSRTKNKFWFDSTDRENPHPVLSDPAAFFNQLDCDEVSFSDWYDYDSVVPHFLGLPYSFWEGFVNEKFKRGSIEYCEIMRIDENGQQIVEKMSNAPITLSDDVIDILGWVKNGAK
ncbi:hypothetical protein PMAYCL1PPCAC_27230, partial [Pristionchus mayeri]